jgi:hypothetical protein
MVDATDTNNFQFLTLQEKFSFFETTIDEVVTSFDEKELNRFLKTIILNHAENAYLRKMAVEVFTDCVFLNKLKVRNELNILIDEWNENEEIFLELRRLKDLFLFYNAEPEDIEKVYQEQASSSEAEIASESLYHLGLIEMQKALLSDSAEDCLSNLNKSYSSFKKSFETIENRLDAEFFRTVTSLIIDLLHEKTGGIPQKIDNLSKILFQRDIFSISGKQNFFHFSFYRALLNLNRLKDETVSNWLDFRQGFTELFYYYSEIKNLEVEVRLNESVLNKVFSEYVERSFIQPYFAQNFPAEISKIDARIHEPDLPPEQLEFLKYVKKLAVDADLKKKSDEESIRQLLINAFPHRNHNFIDSELAKIPDPTDWHNLTQIYDTLAKPSAERFIDALVASCLELQGNKIYKTASEDERNSFIASLLGAYGNSTKDQTRWGTSYAGISAGEIDIFVRESDGTLFAIIEALNLDSLKQDYIKLHIDKIFKYDTSGLKQNFILVYSTAANFLGLWNKYIDLVKAHNYKYDFVNFEVITNYEFAELKIGRAEHVRNDERIFLYHIMLNLNNP